ncbi:UNVERIFIED_ORG: hypothetical protein M2438_002936 [Methylobacterium sp. SuP10 SLI 274]|uniref:hypothetical protein n=1 Tax=Methylorubrum extorquens TaxID=408 RepID=UPI00209F1799|nr:hypothetical protein [Methylorubrum extorquens]MCP1558846.1 hypothetical protein [Methylorubrum extorquens]MDF9792479.1 hypothetical protein [Methylorubrum extorquens]MDH6637761.1 hypothetical protein [Methylobacterium sp. SuP10 SLI 274]MDH6666940.1 hypothetical protein [Methylorubrum zatmanii]
MISQPIFDDLADDLVAEGTLVSYASLQRALRKKYGRGASDRDLQEPYADWRQRRRYKGHLAALDLPEEMEKAIAAFADTSMKVAEARALAAQPVIVGQGTTLGLLEQMQRIVTGLEKQLATLADENRALREQLAPLQPSPVLPEIEEEAPEAQPSRKPGEHKTGAAAIAALAFWDRVVADLAACILAQGRPMSPDELLLEIPQSTRDFAALAFQRMSRRTVVRKLEERVKYGKYGLFRTTGKLFSATPLNPDYRPAAEESAAA